MSRTETVAADSRSNSEQTNGDVFESLETGDKILWDGKETPLTVTAGYKETDEDFAPPVMVEGPRGGEKMLNQNKHDRDRIAVDTFTLSGGGGWIDNLRVVGSAE